MEIITMVGEILKYAIPGILILIAVKMLTELQLKKEVQINKREVYKESIKHYMPLKLSAYERAILFLERISPENLILRNNPSTMNAMDLHRLLLIDIREEYEHNLAQQLYMSVEAWDHLVKAKEEVISFINLIASEKQINEEMPGIEFGKFMLEKYSQVQPKFTQIAINEVKRDITTSMLLKGA